MNKKNIKKSLNWKINDWLKSIEDPKVRSLVSKNVIITGGALVSLLNSEHPNDYDVYFKTKESLKAIVDYYIAEWRSGHPQHRIDVIETDDRIKLRVKSVGVAEEAPNEREDLLPFASEDTDENLEDIMKAEGLDEKYRPVFLSTNAITLSNKIQIVVRFYGSIEDIHKNYDYIHTTCSFDFDKQIVDLPAEALEAIINKELFYQGSRYPLASIIRSRKFITRGWTINAGQYLKMALQLNELNLKDPEVLEDQLVGVDSFYFQQFIEALKEKVKDDPSYTVDNTYLFEVINRIF